MFDNQESNASGRSTCLHEKKKRGIRVFFFPEGISPK